MPLMDHKQPGPAHQKALRQNGIAVSPRQLALLRQLAYTATVVPWLCYRCSMTLLPFFYNTAAIVHDSAAVAL